MMLICRTAGCSVLCCRTAALDSCITNVQQQVLMAEQWLQEQITEDKRFSGIEFRCASLAVQSGTAQQDRAAAAAGVGRTESPEAAG